MGQIVLLHGLRNDPAAAKVLAVWLSPEREDGYTGPPHAPFEMSAVRALRDAAEYRVGPFLVTACKVLDAAEAARLPEIDDSFVDEVLGEEAPVRFQDATSRRRSRPTTTCCKRKPRSCATSRQFAWTSGCSVRTNHFTRSQAAAPTRTLSLGPSGGPA